MDYEWMVNELWMKDELMVYEWCMNDWWMTAGLVWMDYEWMIDWLRIDDGWMVDEWWMKCVWMLVERIGRASSCVELSSGIMRLKMCRLIFF
jgi:hypothetical protein